MPIIHHPKPGTILIGDFSEGFHVPEMIKRRPVVVISAKIEGRPELCTVVALSTTKPRIVKGYHYCLKLDRPLSKKFSALEMWVKADMVLTVGFHRLELLRRERADRGSSRYDVRSVTDHDLNCIRKAVLRGLGLFQLTNHI